MSELHACPHIENRCADVFSFETLHCVFSVLMFDILQEMSYNISYMNIRAVSE